MKRATKERTPCGNGFSYVEVLIAVALIAVALVPILEALQGLSIGAGVISGRQGEKNAVRSRLEEVLAQPFDDLAAAVAGTGTPSTYSDTYTASDGTVLTRNVYLTPYDPVNSDGDNDPFTSGSADLLYVKVALSGTPFSLETLTSR